MEKIKISLASGTSMEKPLVTAFRGNAGVYVVFDNEANGTMGLPIILVSKLENNSLNIIPEGEWNAVKESLRLIIAGNQVDYVTVAPALTASDAFYKQLTLPVASFDALKNNYKPIDASASATSIVEQQVAPVTQSAPVSAPNPTPEVVTPVAPVMPEAPVSPTPVAPATPVMPQAAPTSIEPAPAVAPTTATPVQEVAPVVPNVEPIPEVVPQPEVQVDFTADKEAFLKACENMFDALVAKFKK